MGWRQRLDPARVRVDRLRERAKELRDSGALGRQATSVRRATLRAEFLVPLVAMVTLAAALALSAVRPGAETDTALDTTATTEAVTTVAEASPLPATDTSGYPALGEEPEPSTTAEPSNITATAQGNSGETGYPSDNSADSDSDADPSGYPGTNDAPEPVGTPPSGGFPNVPPPEDGNQNTQPPSGRPPVVPTPPLIPTVPSTGGGYPPPVSNPPSGGAQPPPPQPVFPTPGGVDEPSQNPTPDVLQPTPTLENTPTPVATPVPPTPTARPAEVLSGNIRWTSASSPVQLTKNVVVPAGSFLTIEPGVEVRFGPNVQLMIAGKLNAQGTSAAPIKLVGATGRWDGIVGTRGSSIVLDHVELRQAGREGTVLSSVDGALVVTNSTLVDNGGGIVVVGSSLDLRSTQIIGNSVSGPIVNVQLPSKAPTVIVGNVIGGNRTPLGAPQVLLSSAPTAGPLTFEGNSIIAGEGPGTILNTAGAISGTIRCNSFSGGSVGLQLTSNQPDASNFNIAIDTNAFAGQASYGATGTLSFNLANNWWGDPSGPSDARRNAQGRGTPIGVNLHFQPWLTSRPACAPQQ